MRSRSAGRHGAMVKPQLPMTTRGHAERGGRRGERVPGELGVVVRVDVHDARREREAAARPRAARAGAPTVGADRGDAAVRDGEAAVPRGRAEAVDDAGVVDHEVVHRGAPIRA